MDLPFLLSSLLKVSDSYPIVKALGLKADVSTVFNSSDKLMEKSEFNRFKIIFTINW